MDINNAAFKLFKNRALLMFDEEIQRAPVCLTFNLQLANHCLSPLNLQVLIWIAFNKHLV